MTAPEKAQLWSQMTELSVDKWNWFDMKTKK